MRLVSQFGAADGSLRSTAPAWAEWSFSSMIRSFYDCFSKPLADCIWKCFSNSLCVHITGDLTGRQVLNQWGWVGLEKQHF